MNINSRKNRNKVEIAYSVLMAAKEGIGKTKLMRKVNLNSSQMGVIFDSLLKNGLLDEVRSDGKATVYSTTQIGRKFLMGYEELRSLMDAGLGPSSGRSSRGDTMGSLQDAVNIAEKI